MCTASRHQLWNFENFSRADTDVLTQLKIYENTEGSIIHTIRTHKTIPSLWQDCQTIPCMSCPLQPGCSWLPDLCAQRICLPGTACLRLHPCRKQGGYEGCPMAPSLLVWYVIHKIMLVRSFWSIPETVYFGLDLDFLSPDDDVTYTGLCLMR